jgi:predicted RNA-binding Zn ribbon-like protein
VEVRVRRGGLRGPRGFLFEISGGHPSLDFTNTVDSRPTAEPRELLRGYDDLVSWGRQAGILARDEADALRSAAARRPAEAEVVLGRAREVREALFAIFSAVASRRRAPPEALAAVNAALPQALGHLRLVESGRRLECAWGAGGTALDRMLWPLIRSAAELLSSPDASRVRLCAGEGCAWLFLDRSRNGVRVWCDMSVCGNRAKARRHRQRARRGRSRRVAG